MIELRHPRSMSSTTQSSPSDSRGSSSLRSPAATRLAELDEEILSPSPRRLRGRDSRLRPRPTQTQMPPSDMDEAAEEGAEDGGADLSEDDTEATSMKPRTLRSGKVVSAGQASEEMEEAGSEEVEGEEGSDMAGEAGEESMDECEHRFLLC